MFTVNSGVVKCGMRMQAKSIYVYPRLMESKEALL